MAGVRQTLNAPGATDSCQCYKALVLINFGAGSCDLEVMMDDGSWIKAEVGITADYAKVWASPCLSTIRINGTSVSGDIRVNINPGDVGS